MRVYSEGFHASFNVLLVLHRQKKTSNESNPFWGKTVNCPATVIQDGITYKPGQKLHVHPGNPGSQIAVKIQAEVRQHAKDAVFGQRSSTIINAAIRAHADPEAPPDSSPNPGYLIRAANRIRQLDRPQDSSDLQDEVYFLERHAQGFLRKDLIVDDKRHLIFYTERQLQLFAKVKTWYMDGSFRCVNNPWKQLFSIHGFVKSGSHIKQIPLVFVIMSGKRKEDYYQHHLRNPSLKCLNDSHPDQQRCGGLAQQIEYQCGHQETRAILPSHCRPLQRGNGHQATDEDGVGGENTAISTKEDPSSGGADIRSLATIL
ncbi:uncharacterized protein LOC133174562 [Saccostrea echinata]|uniref:uncharacterized protein LOC133174562 n=1 Tax=Saccostrea echinata TaxID=191078 RepID=UPI002A835C9D|nr:uncharacterized protein LOC133174562 [Saccostrea echinata]